MHFEHRENRRRWLADNHAKLDEAWLIFYKKHTGRASIVYDAAVEEALCYGWIDSLVKRIDEDRFTRKFTPRTDCSRWSAANLRRVDVLIGSGQTTRFGLAKISDDGVWIASDRCTRRGNMCVMWARSR